MTVKGGGRDYRNRGGGGNDDEVATTMLLAPAVLEQFFHLQKLLEMPARRTVLFKAADVWEHLVENGVATSDIPRTPLERYLVPLRYEYMRKQPLEMRPANFRWPWPRFCQFESLRRERMVPGKVLSRPAAVVRLLDTLEYATTAGIRLADVPSFAQRYGQASNDNNVDDD